jgi:hypothetical protein
MTRGRQSSHPRISTLSFHIAHACFEFSFRSQPDGSFLHPCHRLFPDTERVGGPHYYAWSLLLATCCLLLVACYLLLVVSCFLLVFVTCFLLLVAAVATVAVVACVLLFVLGNVV